MGYHSPDRRLIVACLLCVALALGAAAGCGGRAPSPPAVTLGSVAFRVELAQTPAERARGLSGREGLAPMAGMLFLPETGGVSAIWMKGMRFPLDIVWIGGDCVVVDATLEAPPPAPGASDSALPIYRPSSPAAYALEINAGEVERLGIKAGDRVRFTGFPDAIRGARC